MTTKRVAWSTVILMGCLTACHSNEFVEVESIPLELPMAYDEYPKREHDGNNIAEDLSDKTQVVDVPTQLATSLSIDMRCRGFKSCAITGVSENKLIDERTNRLKPKFQSNQLHTTKQSTIQVYQEDISNPSKYGVRFPAGTIEIQVRFYTQTSHLKSMSSIAEPQPSDLPYEIFSMVHNFDHADQYYIVGYYQTDDTHQQDASLLTLASPHPICVDLLRGSQHKVIRRFCKQSGLIEQSEFVEVTLNTLS